MVQRLDSSAGSKRVAKPAQRSLPPAPPAKPVVADPGTAGGYTDSFTKVGGQWLPPAPAATPARIPANSAPASGSGGVGSTSTGVVAPYSAAPPQMSDEEWLAQDAEFNDTRAGLQREFENLVANLARQRADYELDYNNSLRDMGWNANNKSWNQADKLTQYGQAYNNQLGDFASRGLLDSSLYGTALNDLNRGFERQRGDMESALASFTTGQQEERGRAEAELQSAIAQARRQALMRMASGLSL